MALQSSNLIMVGLGTAKDVPPNDEQPPLVDAIHLRWAFKRELGFPWFVPPRTLEPEELDLADFAAKLNTDEAAKLSIAPDDTILKRDKDANVFVVIKYSLVP